MSATTIHARNALLPGGWAQDVRFVLEGETIAAITPGVKPEAEDHRVDHLLPGMSNHHSHAFQRAMAGLAETRGSGTDTFWTWRDVMYRFALSMDPDQMEAVATHLYMEMMEAGFCHVGEFHYLHHDRDGSPYANIGELCDRIAAAAGATGMDVTLLPSFYAHSTFAGAAPVEGQRRFINDVDGFARIVERCRELARMMPGVSVGVAPHSLRAVTPDELSAVVEMAGDAPIHIHVAEQVKEVEDCLQWSGKRPVQWLLDNAPVNDRWCLIHATHLTPEELDAIVLSKATVGLCPVTEGNLGDGISRCKGLFEQGGAFGIGTDSNVLIDVGQELRQLEYSQRLAHGNRAVLAGQGASTGRELFEAARAGGGAALGRSTDLVAGGLASFVVFKNEDAPWLTQDRLIDGWIFGGAFRPDAVWARGRQVVEGGRHVARPDIAARFRTTMQDLMNETGLA